MREALENDELDSLERLAAAATPGPWTPEVEHLGDGDTRVMAVRAPSGGAIVLTDCGNYPPGLADACTWVQGLAEAATCAFCSPEVSPEKVEAMRVHALACPKHPLAKADTAQIALWRMAAILVSAVKAGEPWTATLQREWDALKQEHA